MAKGKFIRRFVLLTLFVLSVIIIFHIHRPSGEFCKEEAFVSDTTTLSKKRVLLTIGVLSKLSAVSRRMAIRKTWFNICKRSNDKVVCTFFTDTPKKNASKGEDKFNDLVYMPYKGAYNFALRLLWMFKHFTREYEFDFFLRVDDDYFVCLDRLLKELPHRPKSNLWWGYIHCRSDMVRVDEGFMILTQDIIKEVLQQVNTTLMCHPFGDQAVALWLGSRKCETRYFLDNDRVKHSVNRFDNFGAGICEEYIGVHQAYPKLMYHYWNLQRKGEFDAGKMGTNRNFDIPAIRDFREVCWHDKKLDWRAFDESYRFEPKLCKDTPEWLGAGRTWVGREKYFSQNKAMVGGASTQMVYSALMLLIFYLF